MRPPSEAGPTAWQKRIFRPWSLATAGGAALGALLLSLPAPQENDDVLYADRSPRAAVSDASGSLASVNDPFAPPISVLPDASAASVPTDEFLSHSDTGADR